MFKRFYALPDKIKHLTDEAWHPYTIRGPASGFPAGTACEVRRTGNFLEFRVGSEVVQVPGKNRFLAGLECDEADMFEYCDELNLPA